MSAMPFGPETKNPPRRTASGEHANSNTGNLITRGNAAQVAFNPEAEAATIGGVLCAGLDLPRSEIEEISPDDFYVPEHQKIWRVILSLKIIDIVTVSAELRRGQPSFNTSLLNQCVDVAAVTSDGWRAHVAVLKESAQTRRRALAIREATAKGDLQSLAILSRADCDTVADLKARFFDIQQNGKNTASEKYQLMAAATVDHLNHRGRFYFHAEHRDHATSMYFDAGRKLLLQISSDEFQSWLAATIGINRSDRPFAFIISRIDDEALTGNTTGIIPESFWANRPGAVYLSNGDGQLVKIGPDTVEAVDNGTDGVLFPRGRTLAPWQIVDPVDPFATCRLFRDMATVAPHGLDLLRLWIISLPTNQRCKPPLVLSGGIGSGKTRAATGIFELFGLPPRVTAVHETGEGDFWTALDAGGLTCFDNADTKIKWLPDALAAAATDGIHEKRKLYSDSNLIQQKARAWSVVTSANPTFASDAGLADRLLVVRLDRRNADTAESALSDEITANRNAGLSFVAYVLSYALADHEPVPANLNRRHPDFAEMAVKIGRAIGREAETIAALRAAEADKSLFNLENDDAGAGLLAVMEGRESFTGTAAELLEALQSIDAAFSADYWTAKRLSKRLTKLWPHIEGLLSGKMDKGHGGIITYRMTSPGGFGGFQDLFSGKSRI